MNQSINTDSKNSKEPQQKYRLETVSIKILGGLNRFYGRPTSPSAISQHEAVLDHQDIAAELAELHQVIFIVPADNESNNIVFVCKTHNIHCLMK